MARVAQLLEGVVERVGIADFGRRSCGHARRIGADVVDQCERAARFEDAPGGADEGGRVGEVVRGEPAGDEIEARIGETQAAGLGVCRLDIGHPARSGKLGGLREHFIGDVGGDDARHQRGKGKGRVAGAGRHVEHAPIGLRLDHGNEARETGAASVYGGRGIVGRGHAELFLDQRFAHDPSSTFCSAAAAADWRRSP